MLGLLYTRRGEVEGPSSTASLRGSYSNLGPDGEAVAAHVYVGLRPTRSCRRRSPTLASTTRTSTPSSSAWSTRRRTRTSAVRAAGTVQRSADRAPRRPTAGSSRTTSINFQPTKGRDPTADEYRVAMGGFSPEMMPVLSTLAREFAVYDAWHAAVPSQTFCNRLFFHASTSHGYVTNRRRRRLRQVDRRPGSPDDLQPARGGRHPLARSITTDPAGLAHRAPARRRRCSSYWKTNFREMEQFHEDAKNGNLPAYSLHRAAHGLQPQRHAPAVGALVRETDLELDGRQGPGLQQRALRRARRRPARARRLRRDPHEQVAARARTP